MSLATVLRHVQVNLHGQILDEMYPVLVKCNGVERIMQQPMKFITNATVFYATAPRRSKEKGYYRSVYVDISPGVRGFMICYGKNAVLASKFTEGQVVSFRGKTITQGKRGLLMEVQDVVIPEVTVN